MEYTTEIRMRAESRPVMNGVDAVVRRIGKPMPMPMVDDLRENFPEVA
jgi:hypothetical protein